MSARTQALSQYHVLLWLLFHSLLASTISFLLLYRTSVTTLQAAHGVSVSARKYGLKHDWPRHASNGLTNLGTRQDSHRRPTHFSVLMAVSVLIFGGFVLTSRHSLII